MNFTPSNKENGNQKGIWSARQQLENRGSQTPQSCGLEGESANNFYLGHTGEVAGPERHREGRFFGTLHFLEHYTGQPEKIEWPDGVTMEVVVIGRIGG